MPTTTPRSTPSETWSTATRASRDDVQTYSNERVREALTGADEDVVVRLYGEDLDVLSAQATDGAERRVGGRRGRRPRVSTSPREEPTLEIEVDLAGGAAARNQAGRRPPGREPRCCRASRSAASSRSRRSSTSSSGARPRRGNSLTSIRQLLIDTPDGGHVRLGDVAKVRIAANPANIKRQAVSRYVDVAADVSGRDRSSVVGDVEGRLQALAFPLEYHAEVLATRDRSRWGRLIAIGIAAAIGIFLLLQACFGSWRLATLAFLTLPLAVAGGFLAALAVGGDALVRRGHRSRRRVRDRRPQQRARWSTASAGSTLEEGEEAERTDLVLRGARERLAPIVADRPGHRAGSASDGGSRRRRRQRADAPARGRRPRRARHVDVGQPVRPSHALRSASVSASAAEQAPERTGPDAVPRRRARRLMRPMNSTRATAGRSTLAGSRGAGLLGLAGCGGSSDERRARSEPAKVEHVEGTNLSRVILTPEAAQRLDIRDSAGSPRQQAAR